MTPEQEKEKAALVLAMSAAHHDIYHECEGGSYTADGLVFRCEAAGAFDDPGRWTTTRHIVYQGPSGSFWRLLWDRGNTEDQPHEYNFAEPELVRRVERIEVDFYSVLE